MKEIPAGVFFLALDEAGEAWNAQTGGYACHRPSATGRLEPLPNELQPVFDGHFSSGDGKYGGWCATSPHDYGGIDQETADWLNVKLASYGIAVDPLRFGESEEAWIYCARDGRPGILTWDNSD